ncbi:hypothetical protein D3C73_727940 [compost metagenome]
MEITFGGLVAQHAALVAKTAEGHVVITLGVLRCGNPIHRVNLGVTVLQAHGTQQVVRLQRRQRHRIGFQGEQIDHRHRVQTNVFGTQVERWRPRLAQDHLQFEPGHARCDAQLLQAMERHEHEFFAEGEIFQQQLIPTERAVALGPQAVLFGETLGCEMAGQRITRRFPRPAHIQGLGIEGQCLMQCTGQGCIGIQIQRQATQIDLAPVAQRVTGKAQAQHRAAVGLVVQTHRFQVDGLQCQVLGGGVATTGALRPDGLRQHFEAGRDHLAALHLCPFRRQFDNGQRWNGAQVMRPQQADQALGQLRQVVVELFAQAPHQEGKAFEQAFHIGIARARFVQVQLRRPVGKGLRKLLAGFAQVAHLGVEITQCQIVHAQKES